MGLRQTPITAQELCDRLKPYSGYGKDKRYLTLEEWSSPARRTYPSYENYPCYEDAVEMAWGRAPDLWTVGGSYQGTHYVLVIDDGKVYYSGIGYGSCSGCDAMEAAQDDSGPLVEEYESHRTGWHEYERDDALAYFRGGWNDEDGPNRHYYYEDEWPEFCKAAVDLIRDRLGESPVALEGFIVDPKSPHEQERNVPEWTPNAGDRIADGWTSRRPDGV
jgi:hypothetical protein